MSGRIRPIECGHFASPHIVEEQALRFHWNLVGKPYSTELALLPDTYSWALGTDVSRLAAALEPASRLPMLAVGSGGSFTVAEFAAQLHRSLGGTPSWAQTPLEAVANGLRLRSMAVVMVTARGSNPDVLGSFELLARREPARLLALCLREGSPLSRSASTFPFVDLVELASPAGRDGFLATNSLLASAVLLFRGYAKTCGDTDALPSEWRAFSPWTMDEVAECVAPALRRRTLVVLFGPRTRAAAIDVESKFTEAALGNVSIADYRQFAHGRHYWIARHAADTAVLALVAPEDKDLASRTLALLPKSVPTVRVDITLQGMPGSVQALAWVLMAVQGAGQARGIDPGRPGVPVFGRRIYHFKAFKASSRSRAGLRADEQIAIERKTGTSIAVLARAGTLGHWRKAYRSFRSQLEASRFCGVVLDYDGTLCGEAERFGALRSEVSRQIERLVRAGLVVGIATGRGKSARVSLRDSLAQDVWPCVLVGYYNGAEVATLTADDRPSRTATPADGLAAIATAITGDALLASQATVEVRRSQITVIPVRCSESWVWDALNGVVQTVAPHGATLLRSSHSFDIVLRGVDKRAVIEQMRLLRNVYDGPVLAIGDRGRFPGNDYLLLATASSLSVDEVSAAPETCWNIAPTGQRGVSATLYHLEALRAGDGFARYAPKRRGSKQ